MINDEWLIIPMQKLLKILNFILQTIGNQFVAR